MSTFLTSNQETRRKFRNIFTGTEVTVTEWNRYDMNSGLYVVDYVKDSATMFLETNFTYKPSHTFVKPTYVFMATYLEV